MKKAGGELLGRFHSFSETKPVDVDVAGVRQGEEMDSKTYAALMKHTILLKDQEVMEIARSEARGFCALHHPWGMTVDDVMLIICYYLWKAEWALLAVPEGRDRIEAIRATISSAIGKARDESKANRACIQPYQVTKVALDLGDVDAAYEKLGEDFAAYLEVDEKKLMRERHEYLEKAIAMMGAKFEKYCRAYLDEDSDCYGSWDKVAERFGIKPTTFRNRELKQMAKRGRKIWKEIW